MEKDPFGHSSPESSPDDTVDEDSSSKKKKKSRRLPLFDTGSEKTDKTESSAETGDDKKAEISAEPLWRRILGQPEEDKERPVEKEEADTASAEESEQTAPLETLSEAEQLEVAEAYIAARHAELIEEQNAAPEDEDEVAVQERAADITLLEAMRRLLVKSDRSEHSLDEPVETAYEDAVHTLGFNEFAAARGAEDTPELEPETLPLPPSTAISLQPEVRRPLAPDFAPAAPAPAAARSTLAERHTETDEGDNARRRVGSALLVGGLVGYFVGRRRGRIKSEKQFKTVETKLTKHIKQVEQQVVQKEQQIRRLAREVYEVRSAAEVRPVRPKEEERPRPERAPVVRTEHLGSITLKAAEAPVAKPAKLTPEKPVPASSKSVERLSRPELLIAAAEVKVGATNLRQVFETHLISEQGLRRLIEEHERGGNVRPALEHEIIEKEMSYERDPRLRNRSVGSLAAAKVVRADVDKPMPPATVPIMTDKTAPAASDKASLLDDEVSRRPSTPLVAVGAVVTLVVIIAVLLVILFTSR